LVFLTWGISWFVSPFFANKQRIAELMDKGFLADKDTKEYLMSSEIATKDYPEFD